MPLDSFVFLNVIIPSSAILSAFSFFFIGVIFGDALFVQFDKKTFIKSAGFIFLGISCIINLLNYNFFTFNNWLTATGLILIFIGFVMDPLSNLKFILPLPIIFLMFLTGHILFFVLSLSITFVIFQLSYTTRHRDLIPLAVGFTLISIGEYFYHLESVESLKQLAASGSFLYLFAALILIGWGWSYLVFRLKRLLLRLLLQNRHQI